MWNTDYPVREPTHGELCLAFGSLDAAYRKTGGCMRLAQYLLANPALITRAQPLPPEIHGGFAAKLREAAAAECMAAAVHRRMTPA